MKNNLKNHIVTRKLNLSICYLLPLFLLVSPNSGWNQSKADIIFGKIKTVIKTNQTCIKMLPTIFLNKREAILDLNNYQIPLKEVAVVFFYNSDAPECGTSWVKFDCIEGNCITSPERNLSGVCISLKSKPKCYELINLFGELQDALK